MRDIILLLEGEKELIEMCGIKINELSRATLNKEVNNSYGIISRTAYELQPGRLLYNLGFRENKQSDDLTPYHGDSYKSGITKDTYINCVINDNTVIIWEDTKQPLCMEKSILAANLCRVITSLSALVGLKEAVKSEQMKSFLTLTV